MNPAKSLKFTWLPIFLTLSIVTAACGGTGTAVALEYTIGPVTFVIDTKGHISVTAGTQWNTFLGHFAVRGSVTQGLVRDYQPNDELLVLLRRPDPASPGAKIDTVYRIDSNATLGIEVNGKVTQSITLRRVVIESAPGTHTTIKIFDPDHPSGPPSPAPLKQEAVHPAAQLVEADFDLNETGETTYLDFDTPDGGKIPDVGYDHVTGRLILLNGTKVARFRLYDWWGSWSTETPSEKDCDETPATAWAGSLEDRYLSVHETIACIRTAEGNLGYLNVRPDRDQRPVAYTVLSHVWMRSLRPPATGPLNGQPIVHSMANVTDQEFYVEEFGELTYIDVDNVDELEPPGQAIDDLAYDHKYGRILLRNGALLANLGAERALTEHDCARTPRDEWIGQLPSDSLTTEVTACMRTAEGNFGHITFIPEHGDGATAYKITSHVWARSGMMPQNIK